MECGKGTASYVYNDNIVAIKDDLNHLYLYYRVYNKLNHEIIK